MKKVTSGGFAVAEAVKLCKPQVLAMYPITPSTFIPEKLSEYVAQGEMDAELVAVESEFSAISALVGASATGVRTFTATSSQGLALMHEILFAASGMRLPIVMAIVNRALSAPLNIWNDHQDSISERDNGWIQLYVENNQEAVDTIIQCFKIAEDRQVLLPVMMCMDGFFLSHTYEPVDIPESVSTFLPDYQPVLYLDPERPMTQGAWASPDYYQDFRKEVSKAIENSRETIVRANDEFGKIYGRKYGDGLVETYGDSDTVVVSLGSICGSLKEVADKKGFEVLRVRSFRPFPKKEIERALAGKKEVIVLEKNISLGTNSGALFCEIRAIARDAKTVNIISGLGGKDITLAHIEKFVDNSKNMEDGETLWM